MRVAAVCALAAASIGVAGCGDGGGEEVVREREGVRLTMSVNGDTFDAGETVEVHAQAENLRDGPLTYGFVGAEPPLQVRVMSDLGGDQIINASDAPLDGGSATLAPGEKIEASAEWDQTLALYPEPAQAPAGEYTITARLLVDGPEGGAEPVEITAAVTVTLSGGEEFFPLEEAMLAAIRHPDLVTWMQERDAVSAICLYQPTETYYSALLQEDRVDESLPDLYRVQLDNGKPVCSPVSVGGEWRVQFFASSGPEPRRVAVYMDIHTGENVRYEEGGLDPLPSPSG